MKWLLTTGNRVAVAILLLGSPAFGELLTDAQLYFDPATLSDGVYPRQTLPDFTVQNTIVWDAEADPILSTSVLPVLKEGDYGPDYTYSQSDYYLTPNTNYSADLTAGTLTATFNAGGLYHVRTIRQSGASATYAILAQGDFGPNDADPASGKVQKMPTPPATYYFGSNEGKADTFIDGGTKAIENTGKSVTKAATIDALTEAIQKLPQGANHVEILAHGYAGGIWIGNEQLNADNAAAFQEAIDPYVSHLTFISCNTGKGVDGKEFLDILNESLKAEAWTGKVGVWYTKPDMSDVYFTREISARYIPEPAAFCLFLAGAMALVGRSRCPGTRGSRSGSRRRAAAPRRSSRS